MAVNTSSGLVWRMQSGEVSVGSAPERAEFGEAQRATLAEGNGELLLASAGLARGALALRRIHGISARLSGKQLVRMIRARWATGAKSGRWRSVLDRPLLSLQPYGPYRCKERKPEIACADLVALSCGRVLQGSPPNGRRLDRAGCTGLIAAQCRSGQVNRNLCQQTSRCSGGPAGGLRARPEGSVVGPRGTHEPHCSGGGETETGVTLGGTSSDSGGSAGWRSG